VNVVGLRERQRQKLLPARGHLLIESSERRGSSGIVGHQADSVDQVSFAEEAQGAGINFRAEFVRAKDLTAHLDDHGFFLVDLGQGLAAPHNFNHGRIDPRGRGLHLMERPLVGLIVLACGRDDRQLHQSLTEWRFQLGIVYRVAVKPYRGPHGGWCAGEVGDSGVVGLLRSFVKVLPFDKR
jgi:hypothetical protein